VGKAERVHQVSLFLRKKYIRYLWKSNKGLQDLHNHECDIVFLDMVGVILDNVLENCLIAFF
jgi:hypothetical protein